MKKILILTMLFCLLLPEITYSQAETNNKNVLKANPLSLLLLTGTIYFEQVLIPSSSLQLGVSVTQLGIGGSGINGFLITPEYRYYFKKNAPDGPYLAPYIRYRNWNLLDDGDVAWKYQSLGTGFVVGRQWVTDSDFSFDIFFGIQTTQGKITWKGYDDPYEDEPEEFVRFNGFGFRAGMTLGFAF